MSCHDLLPLQVVEEWGRVVVPVAGEDGGAVEEGEEAGFLYYALRCPWSRSSKLAPHYALHPEARRYTGPRATDLPSDR